jgi:hypothetical protein
MSNIEDQPEFNQLIRTCQIIIGALIAGVTWFLVILLSGFITPVRPAGVRPAPFGPGEWQHWPISSLAIIIGLAGFAASLLVPRVIVATIRRGIARGTWPPRSGVYRSGTPIPATDAGKLTIAYQTQLIVGAAINEGLTFFALIAYMIESQPIILGLVVLLILGLAARFPTLGCVRSWIEFQQDRLLQDRQSIF